MDRDAAVLRAIPGNVPNPLTLPPGCAFHPRCGYFKPGLCDSRVPPLEHIEAERALRCLRWREVGREPGTIDVRGGRR
jgi:oligopeptide transport system ATP-binding protein